jgi:secondary thiamine-phosphate synthase enzyme
MLTLHRRELVVDTRGRGFHPLTGILTEVVGESGVLTGLAQVFVHHTSASLALTENADPDVLADLETILGRVAPDGDRTLRHSAEGPDDMPAHARSVLTGSSLSIPVARGDADLGAWQGVFLWEHRHRPHRRRITITVMGERELSE